LEQVAGHGFFLSSLTTGDQPEMVLSGQRSQQASQYNLDISVLKLSLNTFNNSKLFIIR
jgi:hypothetical protein